MSKIEGVVISEEEYKTLQEKEKLYESLCGQLVAREAKIQVSDVYVERLKRDLEEANRRRIQNYNTVLDLRRKLKRYRAMLKGEMLARLKD